MLYWIQIHIMKIDGQYSLAYLIQSDERLNVKATYAAPFHKKNREPYKGMEKAMKGI